MNHDDLPYVIVLAAGQGKRMGSPKALMIVDEKPWWFLQHSKLQSLNYKTVWVVSRRVEEILCGMKDAPENRVITDDTQPQFASMMCGIDSLDGVTPGGVYILPVDVPAPSPSTWRNLHSAARSEEYTMPVVPVFKGKRGHPPLLPGGWLKNNLLNNRKDSPKRLDYLLSGNCRELPVDDPLVTLNLNRPEDVARLHELNGDGRILK
ncbi:MAG TPA: hypothetical protein ENJ06_03045 [Phycisphaeraceae bacterium]|nr:hypothetical protein [Phycisphaeraceae bacterium]